MYQAINWKICEKLECKNLVITVDDWEVSHPANCKLYKSCPSKQIYPRCPIPDGCSNFNLQILDCKTYNRNRRDPYYGTSHSDCSVCLRNHYLKKSGRKEIPKEKWENINVVLRNNVSKMREYMDEIAIKITNEVIESTDLGREYFDEIKKIIIGYLYYDLKKEE